jgi:hypothetical protein
MTTKQAVRLVRVLKKVAKREHKIPATRKYARHITNDILKIAEEYGFLYQLVTNPDF